MVVFVGVFNSPNWDPVVPSEARVNTAKRKVLFSSALLPFGRTHWARHARRETEESIYKFAALGR